MLQKKSYVTREMLFKNTEEIIELIKAFRQELKGDISNVRKELKDEIFSVRTELKNDIFTFKDQILNGIVKLREDLTIVRGWSDRMEDHEIRIGKLEKKVLPH